jgi:hypothetical protein
MPFGDLQVEVIDEGYLLTHRLRYIDPKTSGIITVPSGFITDFATVPRIFRWYITGHGKTRRPAVLHDYLYRNKAGTRKQADQLFRDALREEGMSKIRSTVLYLAVRLFGGFSW